MSSRRFWPPDNVLGHPGPQPVELELGEELLTAGVRLGLGHPVEHPVVHHLLARARSAEGAAGLGHVADAAAYLLRLADHVVARDRRRAGGRAQQRDQHPQGGGLAGTVGAEEAHDFTLGDVEVDAVDGLDLLLVLALSGVEGLHESPRVDHGAPLVKCCR